MRAAGVDGIERHGRAGIDDARGAARRVVRREHGDPTVDAEPARVRVGAAHAESLGRGRDELERRARSRRDERLRAVRRSASPATFAAMMRGCAGSAAANAATRGVERIAMHGAAAVDEPAVARASPT